MLEARRKGKFNNIMITFTTRLTLYYPDIRSFLPVLVPGSPPNPGKNRSRSPAGSGRIVVIKCQVGFDMVPTLRSTRTLHDALESLVLT